MKIVSPWKEAVIRFLTDGKPESEALSRARVGQSRFNQEMSNDEDFARRVAAARQGGC
jgi:hypothetical protein